MSTDRRTFLTRVAAAGGAVLASPLLSKCEPVGAQQSIARVAFVKTSDRAAGVSRAIDLLQVPRFHEKDVFIKPNFNSADTPPGSTHMDTLAALVRKLRGLGAGPLTLGDRSGMGNTREVMNAVRGSRCREKDDESALIGEIKRIECQDLARTLHILDGNKRFVDGPV